MSEDLPRTFNIPYDARKKLFDNIKQLVKPEQEHVFRLLKKYKETFTENSNGIFFDLMGISDLTFTAITGYLDFCIKNRQEHEERLKEMDELRNENYQSDDSNDDLKDDTLKGDA